MIKKILLIMMLIITSLSIINATTNDALFYTSGDENSTFQIYDNIKGTIGKFDGAFNFTDGSSLINTKIISKDITGDITISFWANPKDVINEKNIFGDWNTERSILVRFYNNKIQVYTGDGSSTNTGNIEADVNANELHNYIIIYSDSDTKLKLYIDNNLIQEVTTGQKGLSSENLTIGARYTNDLNTNNYDGLLDDFVIYNRVLTDIEISNIYNSNKTAKEIANDFIFYAPMNSLTSIDGSNTILQEFGDININTSKKNNGYDFDGTNDYLKNDGINNVLSGHNTYSLWFKTTYSGSRQGIMDLAYTDDNNRAHIYWSNLDTSDDSISFGGNDGSWDTVWNCKKSDNNWNLNDGNWHHMVITYDVNDASNSNLYIDGVKQIKNTNNNKDLTSITGDFYIGVLKKDGNFFDGQIDEIAIYNRILTTDEISKLYNNGDGYNPYENPLTPIINHNVTTYYNSSSISINLNTTSNVNMSYILNGGSLNLICSDCNNTILNLNGLSNGNYNITFYSNDENGESEVTTSFIIDTIKPDINIIGNLTQDFQVDFSTIFNVSDNISGLKNCQIQINYLENVTNAYQYNAIIGCSDTHTFTANGLYEGIVTAKDNAGNIAELDINGTISTYVTINFLDKSNLSISNYDITITNPNNEKTIITNTNNPTLIYPYYNNELILGVYNLHFEKLGYLTTDINLTINETSGNETFNYNIQNSKIVLKIYNHNTLKLINETTTSITLIPTNYTGSTSLGEINISQINFVDGEYQVILTNDNYQTERVYFNYNNKEILNVNAYMLPTNLSNLGILNVKVEDSINVISNQLVNLQAWDSSSSAYITIGQAKTDSNGDAFFNVELNNVLYKVVGIRDGVRVETPEQVIATSGSIIYLIFSNNLEPEVHYDGEYMYGKITTSYKNATHDLVVLNFENKNNLINHVCIRVNRLKGSLVTQLGEEVCKDMQSGSIEIYTTRNDTSTKEILGLVYIDDGYVKLDNYIYHTNFTIEENLGENLSKWIVLAIFIGVLGMGVVLENVNILSLSLIVISWVVYTIFPNTINYTIPLLITIIMLLVLYGTFKKRF